MAIHLPESESLCLLLLLSSSLPDFDEERDLDPELERDLDLDDLDDLEDRELRDELLDVSESFWKGFQETSFTSQEIYYILCLYKD